MSSPVNMGNVAAMGKQFTTNVFQDIQKRALKSGNKAQIRANRARSAAPAYPSSHTPPKMPTPTTAMGAQMAQGRANRQARAANRTAPFNVTAQTTPTPHASGVPAPSVNPVPSNAVATGRAARQARSQTGQALSIINNIKNNNTPVSAPITTAPSHRAGPPVVTGISQAPGTGRHRAGGSAAPSTPAMPSVQPLQTRGTPQVVNTMQTPTAARVAPSSIIPAAPSALPKTTSGTTVGRSVHQQMQSRIQGTPAPSTGSSNSSGSTSVHQMMQARITSTPKVNTIQNPPSTGANHPYPTHVPPANSSTQPLPTLSAAQSLPGKPNTFTVGSRSIKGGGIASMGSQLEAGLSARPIGLPPKKRRV